MTTEKPVKLIGVRGENTQQLKVFEIDTGGAPAVRLEGKQASGKTCVLRTIEWIIAGKGCLRKGEEIVKRGTGKAKGKLKFNDGTVIERTQTATGTPSLVVTVSGQRLTGPKQDWLDTVFGDRPRDPLAFMRLKGKDQVDRLQAILGLDFKERDAERQRFYDDRTRIGQDKTTAEVKLKDMPYYEDVPEDVVSLSELTQERDERSSEWQETLEAINQEYTRAQEQSSQREKLIADIENLDSGRNNYREEIRRLDEKIELYKKQIEEAEEAKDRQQKRIEEVEMTIQGRQSDLEAITEVDVAPINERCETERAKHSERLKEIDDRIAGVEQTNNKVRANQNRTKQAELVRSLKRQYKEHTDRINAVDEDKAEQVAACKFPIKGISFGSDAAGQPCILYNDMSLANASQGEQLRVSTAIMIEQHKADFPSSGPIVEINQASLLDSENRQMVVDMVAAAGGVVFLEITTDDNELKIVIVEEENRLHPKPCKD